MPQNLFGEATFFVSVRSVLEIAVFQRKGKKKNPRTIEVLGFLDWLLDWLSRFWNVKGNSFGEDLRPWRR